MQEHLDDYNGRELPRPIPESYWLLPGRLLVGEYPGSASRAEAMDRLRRFLLGGVTCFVDLTEPRELPSYESLLPFATPEGRRVEYLREPIPDHGVPATRDAMARIIATIDDALAGGHVVYVHCRAGIGRSATVAGCWLASRPARTGDPLDTLQDRWRQSARSVVWSSVPETTEQAAFVRDWGGGGALSVSATSAPLSHTDRARGTLLGLAVGDAAQPPGEAGRAGAGQWSQHTALALCLAESLLTRERFDARDQIERYLRWQREGHLSASGQTQPVTEDVARALATFQWRGQPMAGSHDPRTRGTASLPRVVSAVLYSLDDPVQAVELAGQCSRTTHQSPFVIDACRYYAALLVGALRGAPARDVLGGLYEPAPGTWATRPLKPMVLSMARSSSKSKRDGAEPKAPAADAVQAVARVRTAVADATDFDDLLRRVHAAAAEPRLEAALAGALMGAFGGTAVIPPGRLSELARRDVLDTFAQRLVARRSGRAVGRSDSAR